MTGLMSRSYDTDIQYDKKDKFKGTVSAARPRGPATDGDASRTVTTAWTFTTTRARREKVLQHHPGTEGAVLRRGWEREGRRQVYERKLNW